ncbi:nucleoside hydrolase [Paenibacillus sp. J2TS4]|uniref:nucleoside hydrolase n=1 Tax=Paenibacillus sp. J2TS4 TaxID=2807194 RepID=UPI001B202038|nr:nucleoside hydrolase [Paenibacillus sp. J2TS4]GIP33413.1 hypothetical protein J2TS4_26230 [Paenibacillus sp. J2TS4]
MIQPPLSAEKRLLRLSYPKDKVRVVIDTDTYNEIDDQFAVIYAMQSPERMQIEALYAAPFHNELSDGPQDGMEKSYEELHKIMAVLGREGEVPIFRGSDAYLTDANAPIVSKAALDLVERALSTEDDEPLYVVAIGAITNVASAILLEPRIIEKIVVVWLGGHALHWPDTKEFNLRQDLEASRVILNSGVPLVLIPCMGVSSHLLTSLSEIRDYVQDKGTVGRYLYETYKRCHDDHFGYTRVIWDIANIGYLNNESWTESSLVPSPVLTDDFRWESDQARHLIRYVWNVRRDAIFQDMFRKL